MEQFDLIMMIMCDFTALSQERRKRLLSLFQSILKPGGSVLLDVYSYRFFEKTDLEIAKLFSDVAGSAYTDESAEFAAVARLR